MSVPVTVALAVFAALVIAVPAVALVGAIFGGRSGYDVDACMKAYEERRAAGEVPDVMTQEPVSLGVGGADQ